MLTTYYTASNVTPPCSPQLPIEESDKKSIVPFTLDSLAFTAGKSAQLPSYDPQKSLISHSMQSLAANNICSNHEESDDRSYIEMPKQVFSVSRGYKKISTDSYFAEKSLSEQNQNVFFVIENSG